MSEPFYIPEICEGCLYHNKPLDSCMKPKESGLLKTFYGNHCATKTETMGLMGYDDLASRKKQIAFKHGIPLKDVGKKDYPYL